MSRKLRNKSAKRPRLDYNEIRREHNDWARDLYDEAVKSDRRPNFTTLNVTDYFGLSWAEMAREIQAKGLHDQAKVGENRIDTRIRNVHVWTYDIPELVNPIRKIFNEVNNNFFKMNIVDCQTPQMCVYYGNRNITDAGHYGWHVDQVATTKIAYRRRLSMSILMNPSTQFEGGELELFSHLTSEGKPVIAKPALVRSGDCVIFDSTVSHRVKPVTAGKRAALVTWCFGESFGSQHMPK